MSSTAAEDTTKRGGTALTHAGTGSYLEVAQHDRDLGARDEKNEQHEGEEAEDVVEALQPDGGHDEEELDEDGACPRTSGSKAHALSTREDGEDASPGIEDKRHV